MYKLYCDQCENRFFIHDSALVKFIEDDNFLIKCSKCGSTEVNLIGNAGKTGY